MKTMKTKENPAEAQASAEIGEIRESTARMSEMFVRLMKAMEESAAGRNGGYAPKPQKGVDYFTADEVAEIVAKATPQKGRDYMTDDEIRQIVRLATPRKGKHYFDGEKPRKGKDYFTKSEIAEFVRIVTPVKGIHYKDGERGEPGIQGRPGLDGLGISAEEIRNKLESLSGTARLSADAVKGWQGMTAAFGSGGDAGSGSTAAIKVYTEIPGGLINGSNVTYTTANNISAVLAFMINGEYLHPFAGGVGDYTLSGNTITMISALPSALAGLPFTIVYV